MSCCVSGLKEIAVNFIDISFQIIEPRIQQHTSVSRYIARAHHLTQPCSSKGLTWMMVVLLMKDVISVVWFALPNWLPDDPKSLSGNYEADVRSGKRAEPWSDGCKRNPGPMDASGILVRWMRAESWSGKRTRSP